MNAEMYIKARKVFVDKPIVEYTETCPTCAANGIDNKLRYYYISLEEAIYKCAGTTCLYPFQQFIFKSLIDNSVYYYEEVLPREALFRVPLDDQPEYYSKNPLSTKPICDSQRNPDIENYDCDLSDLLNDFEPEPEPQTEVKSQPESSDLNPDILEFLDDITPATLNTDKVLDEKGVDDFINNLLADPSSKTVTPLPRVKNESVEKPKPIESKEKPKAKLSKCIQHIEKTKVTKNQKTKEKSTEPFSKAIHKVRKSQAKVTSPVKIETLPVKIESKPVQTPLQLSEKHALAKKSLATALKSANIIRPTALAKQLSSMDFTKTNSTFLRQYLKAKEERSSEGEPSDFETGNENGMPKKTVEYKNSRPILKLNTTAARCETVTSASIARNETAPSNAAPSMEWDEEEFAAAIAKEERNLNKERREKKEKTEKERPKPKTAKKVAKSVKVKEEKIETQTEPTNHAQMLPEPVSKTKSNGEKPPRKRATSKKKNVEPNVCLTEINITDDTSSEDVPLKEYAQNQITTTVTGLAIKTNTKAKKRTNNRKPNMIDSTASADDGGSKPKRARTKATKTAIEKELLSLPISFVSDTESELKPDEEILSQNSTPMISSPAKVDVTTTKTGNARIHQRCLKSQALHSDDSDASQLEPLHGFSASVENVERRTIMIEITPVMASPVQEPTKKRPIDKRVKDAKDAKNIKVEKDDSSENGTSKRPRKTSKMPPVEKQPKPKRASKSQKNATDKTAHKTELPAEIPDLSHEMMENVKGEIAFGLPFKDTIKCVPTTDVHNAATAESIKVAEATNEIVLETNETNQLDAKNPNDVAATKTKEIVLTASFMKKSQKSTNKTQQSYYHIRKVPVTKQPEDKTNQIKKIIADWDDNESEQTNENADSQELDDNHSIISIGSENSDSVPAIDGGNSHSIHEDLL